MINKEVVISSLNNKNGFLLINHLKDVLWNETPNVTDDTNMFILIEGKRQLIRQLEEILNQPKKEI